MKKIRRMPTEEEFKKLIKEHGEDCECCHGKLKREDIVVEEIFEDE